MSEENNNVVDFSQLAEGAEEVQQVPAFNPLQELIDVHNYWNDERLGEAHDALIDLWIDGKFEIPIGPPENDPKNIATVKACLDSAEGPIQVLAHLPWYVYLPIQHDNEKQLLAVTSLVALQLRCLVPVEQGQPPQPVAIILTPAGPIAELTSKLTDSTDLQERLDFRRYIKEIMTMGFRSTIQSRIMATKNFLEAQAREAGAMPLEPEQN